jgi:hypothetical protein
MDSAYWTSLKIPEEAESKQGLSSLGTCSCGEWRTVFLTHTQKPQIKALQKYDSNGAVVP